MLLFITDVITIDKTGENFRLLYDVKGRFTIHRIKPEEAKVLYIALNELHPRPRKVELSLPICAVLSEPSLLAYTL